jgi:4-amino-4-deoxy-L-arabinose transferase-like glycosyltransferase
MVRHRYGYLEVSVERVERVLGRWLGNLQGEASSLWVVFCLAVGTRLLFALLIFPIITADSDVLNTVADDYDKIAHNLVLGHGYVLSPGTAPTMQRLPLYPLFLAFFFSTFGLTLWPIQVAQAVIDALSCVLVYRIAERVYRSPAVSQLATLFYAFYPGAMVATARVVTEPIYTFLLLLAVVLCLESKQTGRSGFVALIGPVLGLAALCKSTGLLLPAYFGVMMQRGCTRPVRAMLKTTVILGSGMAVVLAPWVVRNYLLTGRFIPTSTIGGTVIYDGFYMVNHPDSGREFFELVDLSKQEQYRLLSSQGIETYSPKYPFWFFSSAEEYRWDRLMSRTVVDGFWEAPEKCLRFLFDNAVGFWFVGRTRSASLIGLALHLPFLIAAVVGMRYSYGEGRQDAWLLLGLILYFYLFYTVTLGMVRYAIPIMPLVGIFAAKGIHGVYSTVKNARSVRDQPGLYARHRSEGPMG